MGQLDDICAIADFQSTVLRNSLEKFQACLGKVQKINKNNNNWIYMSLFKVPKVFYVEAIIHSHWWWKATRVAMFSLPWGALAANLHQTAPLSTNQHPLTFVQGNVGQCVAEIGAISLY